MSDPTDPADAVPEIPDVPALAEVLNRHRVRYVVIGGFAAQRVVAEYVTYDVDFSPATDRQNLERLSRALDELHARIRSDAVPEGLPFSHSGESLARAKMWNLQCGLGAFDITFEPAGGGYEHLVPRARAVELRGVQIPMADLADVVISKRLADRAKDREVLPRLEQALAERREAPLPPARPPRRPLGQDQPYRRNRPSQGPYLR